jgi:hypothetical protein
MGIMESMELGIVRAFRGYAPLVTRMIMDKTYEAPAT